MVGCGLVRYRLSARSSGGLSAFLPVAVGTPDKASIPPARMLPQKPMNVISASHLGKL